ncbi:MAG TPA: hypothetical protein VHT97_09140 [Acidimicrobiales bacterium]|nr:hypothetical protein [Acidimicrobiales bacterium]
MRPPLSILAGAVVAVLAAGVLGEYGFDGLTVLGSGVLVGLFVAEAVLSVAKGGSAVGAVATAVLSAGSMVWAGWIANGHRLGEVRWMGWVGVALAALAGGFRLRPSAAARRTRPAPASTE